MESDRKPLVVIEKDGVRVNGVGTVIIVATALIVVAIFGWAFVESLCWLVMKLGW